MRRVKTEIMSKPLAVPSGDGVARVLVGTPSGWAPGIGWSASESSSVTSVDDCDKCEVCEPRRPPSGGESGGAGATRLLPHRGIPAQPTRGCVNQGCVKDSRVRRRPAIARTCDAQAKVVPTAARE